ncbi:MAG: hypothetical protein LBG60_07660 [Bifidobacteriaceae bacterium]|jgi:hypothetical protein|nr:hypothetical protein [Bifidobacteriaceae bacterium]
MGKGKVVVGHLLMAGAGAGALAAWRWQRRWGATAAEQRRPLPGDDAVPVPGLQATRAIGIAAPPSAVWPWLAQIGADRAGFYSYDWLERRAGLDIRDADQVRPEWQDLKAGDVVALAEGVGLRVAELAPQQALVLVGGPGGPLPGVPDMEFSWAFAMEPEGPTGTRLVVRERYGWARWRTGALIKAVNWASFVMSRAMLAGIRDRAERAWRDGAATALDESDADHPADRPADGREPGGADGIGQNAGQNA